MLFVLPPDGNQQGCQGFPNSAGQAFGLRPRILVSLSHFVTATDPHFGGGLFAYHTPHDVCYVIGQLGGTVTYNKRSRTISTRIDHGAVEVLEWKAKLDGIPLRTRIRDDLEAQAEAIALEYNLPFGPNTEQPPVEQPPVEQVPAEQPIIEQEGSNDE